MRRVAPSRVRPWLVACVTLVFAAGVFAQQRAGAASGCERLAMLAERTAKSYLQVAQGLLVSRSRRAVRDSVREFDAQLPRVGALAADAEARENFVLLGLLWKEMRSWAHKPPTRDNARAVSERAEEVSWIASKGARLLGTQGSAQRAALTAMRAATLAQRIARLYLLDRMGAMDARRVNDLSEAKSGLAATLTTLVAGPQDGGVDGELQMARSQHEFLVSAMRDYDAAHSAAAMEVIAKTADNIADSMERAARLYEAPPA